MATGLKSAALNAKIATKWRKLMRKGRMGIFLPMKIPELSIFAPDDFEYFICQAE